MVAGSILPVTIYKNQLYFLFGKENPLEDSAKGWSDFGGRLEGNETPYQAALREGAEELTGFLGDSKELNRLIRKNGGTYKITHNKYHVHIFFLEYDENLPKLFNLNHKFLWDKMDENVLAETKLFEKIEIKWFSMKNIRSNLKQFRPFYTDLLKIMFSQQQQILDFIKSKQKI
tara:strand:+ start:7306 stop:7827 length:522 start_codon:yes stop_codon:yes gene_type:complete